MTLKKLPPSVVNLLSERINDEYGHHYFYRQVSNYCQNVGYLKAAKFFAEESEEEAGHAKMIQEYLTDWNNMPALAPIESSIKVTGLVNAIEKAYEKELELFESYMESSKTLFSMGDYATFDFIKKFRKIQTEALATYSTFLNQLELIDKNDKNWVFQFEKEAF